MKFSTILYIVGMGSLVTAQGEDKSKAPALPSLVPMPSESLRPVPSFSRRPEPSFSRRPRPSEPTLPRPSVPTLPRPSGTGRPSRPSHSPAPRPSESDRPPFPSRSAHSRTHHSFTLSVRPTPPAVPKPSGTVSVGLPPKPTLKDDEDEE